MPLEWEHPYIRDAHGAGDVTWEGMSMGQRIPVVEGCLWGRLSQGEGLLMGQECPRGGDAPGARDTHGAQMPIEMA